MQIKLNCDMGESFGVWKMGSDEALFPYIDMANLACGFHAGDPVTIKNSVRLAKEHGVLVGAHVAYHDLVGFGRRSLACSPEEIEAKILYQMGALSAFCRAEGTVLSYVKPHGALYNDMMKDVKIFEALLRGIGAFDSSLKLMILSTPENTLYEKKAETYGLELLYETFADRNYDNEGYLIPRSHPDALLHEHDEVMQRITLLKEQGVIQSLKGKKLELKADSVCVHGDNESALELVRLIRGVLAG